MSIVLQNNINSLLLGIQKEYRVIKINVLFAYEYSVGKKKKKVTSTTWARV
jgi:hypothetical protein